MMTGLGTCPSCQGPLAYAAIACPHCGHNFQSYGNFAGYRQVEEERRSDKERRRKQKLFRRRAFAIIIALVLILATLTFCHYHNTTQSSLSSQAVAIVQQYYNDINDQNYQDASTLLSPQESVADLKNGYAYTLHDDLTIGSVLLLTDGTVEVSVTVVATERTPSGDTRQRTYKGDYIVGQQDGAWKLVGGMLNPA